MNILGASRQQRSRSSQIDRHPALFCQAARNKVWILSINLFIYLFIYLFTYLFMLFIILLCFGGNGDFLLNSHSSADLILNTRIEFCLIFCYIFSHIVYFTFPLFFLNLTFPWLPNIDLFMGITSKPTRL